MNSVIKYATHLIAPLYAYTTSTSLIFLMLFLFGFNQALAQVWQFQPGRENRIFLQSGLHGDEHLPVVLTHWLWNERISKKQGPLYRALEDLGVGLDILPIADPDGFERRSRLNRNGVNLNRNFSVGWGISKEPAGQKRLSERETRAIDLLLSERSYLLAVDIHGNVPWVVFPSAIEVVSKSVSPGFREDFLGSFSAKEDVRKKWKQIITMETVRLLPHYQMFEALELGDGGSFEDFAFWKKRTLSFCLEMEDVTFLAKTASWLPLASIGQMKSWFASSMGVGFVSRYQASFFVYERLLSASLRQAYKLQKESQKFTHNDRHVQALASREWAH